MKTKTLVRDLERLVRVNTVTTRSNAALAYRVGAALKRRGFQVSYQKLKKGRSLFVNVIGVKGGRGRPLLLCAHLDTVPPGPLDAWTRTGSDPWRAREKGGRLYGLGSADDKGALAAILGALPAGPALGWKRPLMVMGTFGEESGMAGAEFFTRAWRGPKPFLALVAEPTSLSVTYRHKGYGVAVVKLRSLRKIRVGRGVKRLIVHFRGRQAHSSRPWLGENALEKAVRFLRSAQARGWGRKYFVAGLEGGYACNLIPARASLSLVEARPPLKLRRAAGPPSVSNRAVPIFPAGAVLDACRAARLGSSHSVSNFTVARSKGTSLSLTFDFRLRPGQAMKKIFRAFEKRLAASLAAYPFLRHRVLLERDNPPLDLGRGDAAVRLARNLLAGCRLPARLSAKTGCTEAGLYRCAGIPSVVFGPGDPAGNIHAPNEFISIRQLKAAARFYENAIARLCARGEKCF